jgi:hypothetical protein
MDRWEYTLAHITNLRKNSVDDVNRLGAEGWEAVGMVTTWGLGWRMVHPMVLMKRQLAATGPA